MNTWIKTCGMTNAEDAIAAAQLGADAVGLVFHGPSSRCCPPNEATRIMAQLPPECAVVGVWLEESAAEIIKIAATLRLSSIQTYSPAAAGELAQAGYNVIPAIRLTGPAAKVAEWARLLESGRFARMIVDYRGCKNPVGTWDAADLVPFRGRTSVVLAGGLTDENVAVALQRCEPDGVDVASGIEGSPGKKDHQKMKRFMQEVREWDARVSSENSAGASFPKR